MTAAYSVTVEPLDALAIEPRPAQATPWGGEGILRLRVGDWRALYEVDDAGSAVAVIHIGRTEPA